MRHFIPQMSPARRQQILDEAYAIGRLGVDRLPYSVHCDETSDTLIVKALEANALGIVEHEGQTK